MKVSIEMESDDWITLVATQMAYMEVAAKNIAETPLAYSRAAEVTDKLKDQVIHRIPTEEFDAVMERQKQRLTW